MRAAGQHRIEFLAKVRNEALLPIQDPSVRAAALSRAFPLSSRGLRAVWGNAFTKPTDRVIFINDVFFAWQVRRVPAMPNQTSPTLASCQGRICWLQQSNATYVSRLQVQQGPADLSRMTPRGACSCGLFRIHYLTYSCPMLACDSLLLNQHGASCLYAVLVCDESWLCSVADAGRCAPDAAPGGHSVWLGCGILWK
jgi:hypothetical protein